MAASEPIASMPVAFVLAAQCPAVVHHAAPGPMQLGRRSRAWPDDPWPWVATLMAMTTFNRPDHLKMWAPLLDDGALTTDHLECAMLATTSP